MSRPRIMVINPNSNRVVTAGLAEALKPLMFGDGPEIVCETLAEGPFGIESQADADSVVMPLKRFVESDTSSAAFVIACYSDPGLHVCREATARPVLGIAECGVLTALTRAETFGVIAIAQRSIRRHLRYLRQMGLTDRLAAERPLDMSVAETASGEGTLNKMILIGRALKEEDGAGAIVMGCAGVARHGTRRCARHPRDRSDTGRRHHGAWRGTVRHALMRRRSYVPAHGGGIAPVRLVIRL
jgi:allantoin racemase